MSNNWYFRLSALVVVLMAALVSLAPNFSAWLPVPTWLSGLSDRRISPGLDIQGGLRLVYEVEVEEALKDRRDRIAEDVRLAVFRATAAGKDSEPDAAGLRTFAEIRPTSPVAFAIAFNEKANADIVNRDFLKEDFPDIKVMARDDGRISFELREERIKALEDFAVDQTARTISNRIDELAIRETTVIPRDRDIIVEVPGADDASFDRIRSIISKTAKLAFQIAADKEAAALSESVFASLPAELERQVEQAPDGSQVPYLVAKGDAGRLKLKTFVEEAVVPPGFVLLLGRAGTDDADGESTWRTWLLESRVGVSGEDIDDAFVSYDPQEGNRPFVAVNFTPTGGRQFKSLTGAHVNERMAVVLDGRVESAPVIQQEIGGGRARITLGAYGDYNKLTEEARDLALVFRAGALPAPIRPSNEQMIGPSLGLDSVRAGVKGALIGISLVFLFMVVYYQLAGLIAVAMVSLNVTFLLALLSAFEATLTLPGIAGIALTVGMAVDANVLITERIREEMRLARSPRSAVEQGFSRAFWSVVDAQATTFIAGIVLYQFGTGPIKGFAVTLMLGILTSLFTGIFCSRVVFDGVVQGLRLKRLPVG